MVSLAPASIVNSLFHLIISIKSLQIPSVTIQRKSFLPESKPVTVVMVAVAAVIMEPPLSTVQSPVPTEVLLIAFKVAEFAQTISV